MADASALELQTTAPGTYRQRGASSLQRLFRTHFPEFAAGYDAHYARRLSRSRLQRITRAVERFPLSPIITTSLSHFKKDILGSRVVSLDMEETLIALSISAAMNPTAQEAVEKLAELRG